MMEPQAIVWDVLYGRWRSQALYAGVKLGIFEVVDGALKPAGAIAAELGLDARQAYRLLRALGSIGVLEEDADRRFKLSAPGAFLQSGHPQSLRDIVLLREGPEHSAVWKHLPSIVRDGKQDGFVREFGCTAFEYAAVTPSYANVFDAAMSSYSAVQTGWTLDILDGHGAARIAHLCDVGGGQGHLAAHFLARHEDAQATVLERAGALDEPAALWAGRLGVGARCRYLSGDMFADVPRADAYVFKMILHNWNDAECVRLLRVARGRAPASGRVFVVEHVVPDHRTPHPSKLFDLHMLCWGTGRERSAAEFAALLAQAGWAYEATWASTAGPISVVAGANA